MGFNLSDNYAQIHTKNIGFVLCLESPDADLKILKNHQGYAIKNYRAFVSNAPPPFPHVKTPLRIAVIVFAESLMPSSSPLFSLDNEKEIFEEIKKRNPHVTETDFHNLLQQLGFRFVKSLTRERLVLALDMFFRAKTRDNCQYEVRYNQDWAQKKETPSLQIVFAWRNVPKYNFLYRMAQVIYRHGLTMKRVNAVHIDPYNRQNTLIMSLGLHGSCGKAAWEETDISDFLKELVTLKYFEGMEMIESVFIDSKLLTGNLGNLVKTMVSFVHQVLVHADVNMYALNHIEEGICRHPDLIVELCKAFELKFHPEKNDIDKYIQMRNSLLQLVDKLDTGNELNDTRRKNILKQAIYFVDSTLKTNFFRNNKTAFSFRLDPRYLDTAPFDRKEKFPELPYAIFFMKGLYFLGFHIRFRDLSRGGLRTVFPERMEQMVAERNHVFSECYQLAYTQNKKNKDIPEGGAKGVIFLEPYERLYKEEEIYTKELQEAGLEAEEVLQKLKAFHKEQKLEYLHQTQRSYIESFVTILNCDPDGNLRPKGIIDYWKRPEYIYLGPDENMHNEMIEWISWYSQYYGYKPGNAFISSKPGAGINHKEYGVTSLGVNVYMEEVLKFLHIDPQKDPFTIKITGGPDGDVAGNQLYNLYRFYPQTAKLLALIDGSGTIFDPIGLNLKTIASLFSEGKPIRFYPAEELNEGGFLLDTKTKKEETEYSKQTLCLRKIQGKVIEDWLSGNEMNHILRHNVHQTSTTIFIPAGGRPRTLNEGNYKDFLDETGKPTSLAIIEGANLYLTPWARRNLEKSNCIIIKDSSSNKGGVICSSFEVLFSLVLSEEEFLKEKPEIVKEILEIICIKAQDEARLLLKTHEETRELLTDISDQISERINLYKDQLLNHFYTLTLSNDPEDLLIRCLLSYCPPLLRKKYPDRVLLEVPDVHKKGDHRLPPCLSGRLL
ncbi:MAG: NAD-glutamate dehydrogenase [Chlamydiales bacterium]|nr:NAD-glutamate dehydrogenase [Chlamydiales bacterium]